MLRADAPGRVATVLELASATVLLGVLAIAPWLRTPLRTDRAARLEEILAVGVALGAVSVGLARRRPRVPAAIVAAVALVIAFGLWMAWNASGAVAFLPGSVDGSASSASVRQLGSVLACGLALTHVFRRSSLRVTALWALALSGASVGAFGALDRFRVGPVRFPQIPHEGSHFGPFAYHANAAAFLNITLPAALFLALRASGRVPRLVAVVCAAGVLLGCATHVSKAGQVVTVAQLLAFSAVLRRRGAGVLRLPKRTAIVLVALVVGAFGVAGSAGRWRKVGGESVASSGRVLMWKVAVRAWLDAPLVGNGPGTLKVRIPPIAAKEVPTLRSHWIVTIPTPGAPDSIWMRAHNDVLQTLAEWGLFGTMLLAGIVAAPLMRLRRWRPVQFDDAVLRRAASVAMGGVLVHGLVDFPLQILPVQLCVACWGAVVLAATDDTAKPAVSD